VVKLCTVDEPLHAKQYEDYPCEGDPSTHIIEKTADFITTHWPPP